MRLARRKIPRAGPSGEAAARFCRGWPAYFLPTELSLFRVFPFFIISPACATVCLQIPEQRESGNRRVALSSFFPLPRQIGLVFSLFSSIFPYGYHLGRVVRNETWPILVLHPKIHMFAFHSLNHKPSFYISYVLMIITPNLDNYCLYTHCGGLAVRQDRHNI